MHGETAWRTVKDERSNLLHEDNRYSLEEFAHRIFIIENEQKHFIDN